MQDDATFCAKCGSKTERASKEKGKPKKSRRKAVIIVVLSFIFLSILLGTLTDDSSSDTTGNTHDNSTNITEESDSVLYTDDYFTIEYIDLYEVDGITAMYLMLKVTNNSNEKLILSLDDVYINDMLVESGTGMPIELEADKISQSPFIIFSGNTGLSVNDVEKIEFMLNGLDKNYNSVHITEKITINK